MSGSWSVQNLQESFQLLYHALQAEQGRLDALDSAAGDGDHGTTVCSGFQSIVEATTGETFADMGSCLNRAATAFIESTGGAIGPILGAFWAEGASTWSGLQEASPAEWTAFLSKGAAAVQTVGKANPGDKTLIDALLPAASAFAAKAEKGENLKNCFKAAAAAAQRGAAATVDMVARRGRARFLGKRSLGRRDAGAETVALIFETWRLYTSGQLKLPAGSILTGAAPGSAPASVGKSAKFINNPGDMIPEELEGFAMAYPRRVKLKHPGILTRAVRKDRGKTALCIGHGGGHTPSMAGFIGPGLLDAAVVGSLFTCAAGTRIAAALREVDRGGGIVLLISSHEGDILNARLALRLAEHDGIRAIPFLHYDDISTAPPGERHKRRGLGGLLFAVAIGGAAAEAGLPIDEVVSLMEQTRDNTVTLSAAAAPPTHPATGESLFQLSPGEMEIGTGVHGEGGVYRGALLTADKTIELVASRLLADLPFRQGDETLVFFNGSGGISYTELHILYRGLHQVLEQKGVKILDTVIGEYFTTFEMGGFSLSLCKADARLKRWWFRPSRGVYFKK